MPFGWKLCSYIYVNYINLQGHTYDTSFRYPKVAAPTPAHASSCHKVSNHKYPHKYQKEKAANYQFESTKAPNFEPLSFSLGCKLIVVPDQYLR